MVGQLVASCATAHGGQGDTPVNRVSYRMRPARQHLGRVTTVTSISQMISNTRTQVSSVANQSANPTMGTRQNDGYQSLAGSVVRNGLVGAGLGALIGAPTGIGIPIGAGVGAAVGIGSALIRTPRVANAAGDALKAGLAGAAGGAVVGTITPFGPVGGAIAGGVGGMLTGITSGLLKKVNGGKWSVEGQTTVWGRISRGFMLGALSGGAVGTGAGLLFGGIGALPGALWGAAIGGIGGAAYGLMSGTVDAATGAKGARFFGAGGSTSGTVTQSGLPHLGKDPSQVVVVEQSPIQCSVKQVA